MPAAPAALALAAGAGLAVPQAAHAVSSVSVSSTTVTAALPPGVSATCLPAGCTTGTGTVTCTFGAIANGAGAAKSFRVPLHLFSLGHVTVTGTRTASTPADPNPADDTDSATCTVVSVLPATCP
ncbi:hypothetical protein ACFYXL_16640 [Streptomyces tsukubensis]|uniref:hypothetical protein n=1 Tax=Streptomyces tsukubensis TaxID=83656 RepID=UPI00369575E5